MGVKVTFFVAFPRLHLISQFTASIPLMGILCHGTSISLEMWIEGRLMSCRACYNCLIFCTLLCSHIKGYGASQTLGYFLANPFSSTQSQILKTPLFLSILFFGNPSLEFVLFLETA